MSYDDPQSVSHVFGDHVFSAGDATLAIRGPAGKKGRLEEITVSPSVTFNAVTSPAAVQVGITGSLTRNANFPLGTTAAGAAIAATQTANALVDSALEADTDIIVTLIAPVGGTPAGTGHVMVMTEWY